MKNIKLSALNLVPIREGQEDKDAINDTGLQSIIMLQI